jgi:hypothetical protein
MERENLILEYVKVLLWPVILIAGFAFYSDKLFGIIENREIDAFGLKIGNRLEEVVSNYKTELEALKIDISDSNDSALLKKVEIIEMNLDRGLTQVKQAALTKEDPSSSNIRKERVAKFERNGFTAIISRDVVGAITAFSDASDVWPTYHNVSEIRTLLVINKQKLDGDDSKAAWTEVIKKINDEYSWGIPSDIRKQLIE